MPAGVTHILALLGVVSISFSAIFVRLASVSPVTATFYRAVYAVPVLAVVWALRAGDRRSIRVRALAAVSGLILAVDLNLWHASIALIGAGLGTVIANSQVMFVALAGWFLYGERPTRRTAVIVATVLAGVAMTSGFARHDAYGSNPVAGVVLGIAAGACYAAFLLVFRAANQSLTPGAGPLLDATIGVAAGALACAPFDPRVAFTPTWPAHLWLVLLALLCQVVGWLLIAAALPRLPALDTSVLLLGQPVCSVIWSVLIFDERLSPLQWIGALVVLGGVTALSIGGAVTQAAARR